MYSDLNYNIRQIDSQSPKYINMNYHHTDDVQAQRLKQILFPRKTRSSRTSINTSISTSKQNQQTNHSYNIKQQINKLKQGIQLFMDKQPLTDNFLTTPRECLQIIKCMSDKMINYRDEIEQAINTLVESVPKPLSGVVHGCKYYMMYLKIGYLCSVVGVKRRRILASGMENIRQQAQKEKMAILQQQQQALIQHQRVEKIITDKMSKAFNRWRLNACRMRKSEIQAYFYDKNIVESTKMLKLLPDESRMVLWLHGLVQGNADAVEILLYNGRTNTIRGYQPQAESLTSMFESVHNESRVSHVDQSMMLLNNKIKRLEINLDHSLTKICIIKRQSLTVSDMRRDPDYNKIDDLSSMHGLTSRDLGGACIFTPIMSPSRNACIGIIRQYFYTRVGQPPHADTISIVSQMLQHSTRTNTIFQQVKQQSHATRNRSYLKAVLILNQLERDQQFGAEQEQQFYKQLCSYYPIKYMAQFGYQAINTVDKCPRYSVSVIGNQASVISTNDIVCALSTMAQCQTQWVLASQYIYIKLPCKIYVFQLLRNVSGDLEQVPASLIRELLGKKEQIKDRKQKEYKMLIEEKQRLEEEQKQKELNRVKSNIMQYCLRDNNVRNGQDMHKILMEYVHTFVAPMAKNVGKLDIRIASKLNTKNNTYARSNQETLHQLYSDQKIQIFLTHQPTLALTATTPEIPQLVTLPLADLCSHLVSKLYKPHSFPSLSPVAMHTKSQLFYLPNQPQTAIANLLTHALNIQPQHITHTIHLKQQTNPFIAEHYHLYLQSKHVTKDKQPQHIIKMIKSYASLQHSHLQQLSTVICLDSELVFVVDRYLDITEQLIGTFNDIYKSWKYQESIVNTSVAKSKRNTRIVEAVQKIHHTIIMDKIKYMFYQIKNSKIKIRHIPNMLEGYIYRENKKCMNYALSCMKRLNINKHNSKCIHSYAKLQYGIRKIISIVYKMPSIKLFFNKIQQSKYAEKKLKKFNQIFQSNLMKNLISSFNLIYMKKHMVKPNKFVSLQTVFNKVKVDAFKCIKRYAKILQSQQIIQSETECSILSKSNKINEIGQLIRQKFPSFQTYIYLKNGSYLALTMPNVTLLEELKDKTGYQHYQFTCQSKGIIRNTLWLVPDMQTITLIEKHYLQVLSRAIELGFSKFIYNNEQFIAILTHFATKKSKKLQQKALKNLREFTMNKVRVEEYSWRDKYYQASIQVQNYKLMEREQKIEQQQRMIQLAEALETKKNCEDTLSQYRKKIVRLEVSSRHLEQIQTKVRLQTQRQQTLRMFNSWRLETAYHKKYAARRQLARKKQQYILRSINRLVESKVQQNFKSSLTMILVKSADVKAKSMSEQKSVLQRKDQNRLLTFQDELNQFISASETQRERQYQQQKQISIIPISFKHFEGSKKENYDVTLTDDEARKMNGGAYKLNAKTLKFLKRMGKLNQ